MGNVRLTVYTYKNVCLYVCACVSVKEKSFTCEIHTFVIRFEEEMANLYKKVAL